MSERDRQDAPPLLPDDDELDSMPTKAFAGNSLDQLRERFKRKQSQKKGAPTPPQPPKALRPLGLSEEEDEGHDSTKSIDPEDLRKIRESASSPENPSLAWMRKPRSSPAVKSLAAMEAELDEPEDVTKAIPSEALKQIRKKSSPELPALGSLKKASSSSREGTLKPGAKRPADDPPTEETDPSLVTKAISRDKLEAFRAGLKRKPKKSVESLIDEELQEGYDAMGGSGSLELEPVAELEGVAEFFPDRSLDEDADPTQAMDRQALDGLVGVGLKSREVGQIGAPSGIGMASDILATTEELAPEGLPALGEPIAALPGSEESGASEPAPDGESTEAPSDVLLEAIPEEETAPLKTAKPPYVLIATAVCLIIVVVVLLVVAL